MTNAMKAFSSHQLDRGARWRLLAVVAALSWSCGFDRLTAFDSEPLDATSRHELTDDVARAIRGLQVVIPFFESTRAIATAGVPGGLLVASGSPTPQGLHRDAPPRVVAAPLDSDCIAVEWSSPSGLERRLLARACPTPSGDIVDGLITLDIGQGEFAGVRNYTFTELHVGDQALDGALTMSAPDVNEMGLTGDIRFVRGIQSVRILATAGRTSTKLIWVDLDGLLSSSAGVRYSLEARAIQTAPGGCFPDRGSVQLTRDSETLTLEFETASHVELRSTLGLAEMWTLPACP